MPDWTHGMTQPDTGVPPGARDYLSGVPADPDWHAKGIQSGLDKARAQMQAGEITPTQFYQFELNTLGRSDYMEKYGIQQYDSRAEWIPKRDISALIHAEIADLRDGLKYFSGPEATWVRWLIEQEINTKRQELARFYGRDTSVLERQRREAPAPDWMKDYIDKSMPALARGDTLGLEPLRRRGRQQEPVSGAGELRPLGAQAKLTPEQQAMLAGYQAWGRTGAPTRFSEQAITGMSDWQGAFDEYTRLSQALFPKKVKLGRQMGVARQR